MHRPCSLSILVSIAFLAAAVTASCAGAEPAPRAMQAEAQPTPPPAQETVPAEAAAETEEDAAAKAIKEWDITNPPGDGRVNVTPAPLPGARRFYRLRADY